MRGWSGRVAAAVGAVLIGAAGIDPAGAAGIDPAVEAKTKAFLERPEQLAATERALSVQAGSIPFTCPALTLTQAALLIDLPAPRFDAGGTMVDGRVRQRFSSGGCGGFRLLFNVWVIAKPGEAVRTVAAHPGTSGAALDLQEAATPTATVAAGQLLGGCGSLDVIDTLEVGPDAPGASAWREVWLVGGCGIFAQVLLRFVPDPRGGRTLVEAPPEGVRRLEVR